MASCGGVATRLAPADEGRLTIRRRVPYCPTMRCAQAHSSQLSASSRACGAIHGATDWSWKRREVRSSSRSQKCFLSHFGKPALKTKGRETSQWRAEGSVDSAESVTRTRFLTVSKRVRLLCNSRSGQGIQNRRGAQR